MTFKVSIFYRRTFKVYGHGHKRKIINTNINFEDNNIIHHNKKMCKNYLLFEVCFLVLKNYYYNPYSLLIEASIEH
jgi:hypothetical protein